QTGGTSQDRDGRRWSEGAVTIADERLEEVLILNLVQRDEIERAVTRKIGEQEPLHKRVDRNIGDQGVLECPVAVTQEHLDPSRLAEVAGLADHDVLLSVAGQVTDGDGAAGAAHRKARPATESAIAIIEKDNRLSDPACDHQVLLAATGEVARGEHLRQ